MTVATPAEVLDGTDNGKVITPKGLKDSGVLNEAIEWNVLNLEETEFITQEIGDDEVIFAGNMTLPYGRLLEFDITFLAEQSDLPIAEIRALAFRFGTRDYITTDPTGRYKLSENQGLLYDLNIALSHLNELGGPKFETSGQVTGYEDSKALTQQFFLPALPNSTRRKATALGTIKGFATVTRRFNFDPNLPIDTPTTIPVELKCGLYPEFASEFKFLGGLIKWRYANSANYVSEPPNITGSL
jgi:hypothetical protein